MIRYQDEKMYGENAANITIEELDEKINKLELELYGHRLEDISEDYDRSNSPQMVYDIRRKELVPIDEVEWV